MSASSSEIKQIQRIAAGEVAQLEQLYGETSKVVYRYLMRMLGKKDVVDNCMIATYLDVWDHAPDYEGHQAPLHWIVRFAREQAHKAAKEDLVSSREMQLARDEFGALDRQRLIAYIMNVMPRDDRETLVTMLMPGFNYPIIADVLEIDIEQVKTRLFAALGNLKNELKKQGIKKSDVSKSTILRELIPLYINGALEGKHKLAFEKSLKGDRSLKQEYIEFYEVETFFDQLELPGDQHLDTLFLSINNELVNDHLETEAQLLAEEAELVHHGKHHFITSANVGWGLAVLQLVVFLIVIVVNLPDSSTSAATTPNTGVPVMPTERGKPVNVVFADDAKSAQIRDLLLGLGASMYAGPTDIGLYTISVPGSDSDVEQTIIALKKSDLVVLAAPAF